MLHQERRHNPEDFARDGRPMTPSRVDENGGGFALTERISRTFLPKLRASPRFRFGTPRSRRTLDHPGVAEDLAGYPSDLEGLIGARSTSMLAAAETGASIGQMAQVLGAASGQRTRQMLDQAPLEFAAGRRCRGGVLAFADAGRIRTSTVNSWRSWRS